MDRVEKKIQQKEKKRKEKFLEDYFSLCTEHGFCIDSEGYIWIADYPSYVNNWSWNDIKKELMESL